MGTRFPFRGGYCTLSADGKFCLFFPCFKGIIAVVSHQVELGSAKGRHLSWSKYQVIGGDVATAIKNAIV